MPISIGKNQRVFIVAEIGLNAWPFSMARLSAFIEAAKLSGTDAIKVQLFRAGHFPKEERSAKAYVEFPRDRFQAFIQTAQLHGLAAGASVFDLDAIVRSQATKADFIKLATREQWNIGLTLQALRAGLPVFRSVDWDRPIERIKKETLLGCVPEYPASYPVDRPLVELSDRLGRWPLAFGWSSHTSHWVDVLEAVRQGATVIEKHLALSDQDQEADWSLLPHEFQTMVDEIRRVES